jgi:hypothetical protein
MWKKIAPDRTYIDYFQKESAVGRGLTNRFGVRITEEAFASVIEIADGQPFTFGESYPLPVKLETLPNAVRMVIEDHVSNQPDSDLTAVLTGRKSFQEALASPAGPDVKRATAKSGEQFE